MKCVEVFTAEWCFACGPVKNALMQLEADGHIELEVHDVDKNPELVEEANIRSIPAIFHFDSVGNVISSTTGGKTIEELKEWLGIDD
jgi:thioredoxin-like negative regulator of GroEL